MTRSTVATGLRWAMSHPHAMLALRRHDRRPATTEADE